jgi:Triosephosphate isomerase
VTRSVDERPASARNTVASGGPVFIGVSLKAYFDHDQTVRWCEQVRDALAGHPYFDAASRELVVLPGFASLAAAGDVFAGGPIGLGAQNLWYEDRGAFTGEVGGTSLRQLGCTHVEVGHAERRRIFGEDDATIERKIAAAARNGLTPILCVGERDRVDVDAAAATCIGQVERALERTLDAAAETRIVVAYEPEWAIGVEHPAPVEHITGVGAAVRSWLDGHPSLAGSVIYGGSAGPGLWTELHGHLDGLFLGRFAHRPDALRGVLDEVVALAG